MTVIKLPAGEIHVWHFTLDVDDDTAAGLHAVLAESELQRAARFHFDRNRRRYIAGRAAMRHILARYLAIEARHVIFRYDTTGKPELDIESGTPPVRFNLSHTRNQALLAITRGNRIGIDIEAIDAQRSRLNEIAATFSTREQAALAALAPHDRVAGFFRCWARKEAVLKALGIGVGSELARLSVSVDPDHATLMELDTTLGIVGDWTLIPLEIRDHAAAIAVEGAYDKLEMKEWGWPAGRDRNSGALAPQHPSCP